MKYRTTDLYEAAYYVWQGLEPVETNKMGMVIEWAFEYTEEFKNAKDNYNLNIREYISNIIKLKAEVKELLLQNKKTKRL